METTTEEKVVAQEIAKRVREILELLGEDPNREGLRETPARVAKALLEMTSSLRTERPEVKVFSLKEEGEIREKGQLVIGKNIRFTSICEHHLLPFLGRISIAYVVGSSNTVAGFSKLVRLVNYYSSRPQIQERLVQQIADSLMESDLKPAGVLVHGEAVHMCVYVRGVKDGEASLSTLVTRGVFEENEALVARALRLIKGSSRRF